MRVPPDKEDVPNLKARCGGCGTVFAVAEASLALAPAPPPEATPPASPAGLGLIPLAGRFLAAFVQCYTYLAIGCLLGLAVFKKAPELDLD
jgi:hypothetical protein